MSSPSPIPNELANELLNRELARIGSDDLVAATDAVCARLDASLSRAIGAAGYRALVERALAITQEDHAVVRMMSIDGSPGRWLRGVDKSIDRCGRDAAFAGVIALLTELFHLLSRFVGEPLAVRLIRAAWRNADPAPNRSDDPDGPNGSK
jgi:hypothetical protein